MEQLIRVLHLILTFDTERGGGGLTRFATTLGKHLDPGRFEVSLCALADFGTTQEKNRIAALNTQGIRAFTATKWVDQHPYQSLLNATRCLNSYLARNPVDILHSHSEFSDITAILLKKKAKTSTIMRTVQYGYQQEWRNKPWRRLLLTNFLYPICFNVETGVNQEIVNRLNQRLLARILGKKARLIYNAVDISRFSQAAIDPDSLKKDLGIPPASTVVCSIGRLAEQKGYSFLIAAIPTVLKWFPNVYFLIIGEGNLADELNLQVKELNISHNLIFTGPRSDIVNLLQISDIYVTSSLWEGLPVTLLEAMASHLPIIATDIPGTNELVQDQVSGLLVPPADPHSLAEALLHLIQEPALRKRLVQQASERIKQFSLSQIVQEYEQIYQGVI